MPYHIYHRFFTRPIAKMSQKSQKDCYYKVSLQLKATHTHISRKSTQATTIMKTYTTIQNGPKFPDVLVHEKVQRLPQFFIQIYARGYNNCVMAQDFSGYARVIPNALLTTRSVPFLAVLNELQVGGRDPSTIHQPACLGITSLNNQKLSSSGLPGMLHNQTVITPSGLPATIYGKFGVG